MMRLLSILLLSVILVQTSSKLVIFVNYEMNKKQITEQYCVNKNNPMAHCDGMCHMIKQMQKDVKQGKPENAPVKSQNENLEIQLFSQSQDNSLFNIYLTGDYVYSIFQSGKISSLVSSIFHPPTC